MVALSGSVVVGNQTKEPMLCHTWCTDIAVKRSESRAHGRTRALVKPPFAACRPRCPPLRLYIPLHPPKWRFIERELCSSGISTPKSMMYMPRGRRVVSCH